jgi:hypothetical protein
MYENEMRKEDRQKKKRKISNIRKGVRESKTDRKRTNRRNIRKR